MAGGRRPLERDPTLLQVLSLYLLLLAFFVVLYNASRFDRGRADAVGASLTSTFRAHGRPTQAPQPLTSAVGDRLGDAATLAKAADLVMTELAVAEIEIVRPGRTMLARVPVAELFVGETAAVRGDRTEFIGRFAGLVRDRAEGLRHKVEISVSGENIGADVLGNRLPRPIARASALAESLLAAGATRGNVSGGIREGAPGTVELLFRIDPDPAVGDVDDLADAPESLQ